MKNNKGITLVELIVTIGLIFLVIPIFWYYINMSFEDNATLNDKVAVQTSVSALMNQLQRDIQEATKDISPDISEDVIYEDINELPEGVVEYLICKPNEGSVLYRFNQDKNIVTGIYNLRLSIDNNEVKRIMKSDETYRSEYAYINGFSLIKDSSKSEVKVSVTGKISSKSNYNLSNTYYSRNTVLSSEI